MISADVGPGQEWALRSEKVFTPEGVYPAAVIVTGEQIAAVVGFDEVPAGMRVEDVGERMVLPGLVDTHVHINEPGRTDWEGFATATKAAAAGGVTTLIDMPLNSSPVTTSVAGLTQKREAAAGQLWVDVGFHGGVIPGNVGDIQPLIDEGVCAFKAFLCHSGIDEFPNATEADLRQVMPILAKAKLPLFVHAELVGPLPAAVEAAFAANPRSYQAYLATRPPEWEVAAIEMMVKLCRETGCHVHIVHLAASGKASLALAAARKEGLSLTVETCPHYLNFEAESIPDGDTRFKCAPPIRPGNQRKRLLSMLFQEQIATIGSDHSPAPPELKHLDDGNLREAWGGIASLQLLLPAVWTVTAPELHAIDALTIRPAALVGLSQRKGSLRAGLDADMVVFDAESEFQVSEEMLQHRHKATPYSGRKLAGVVETTYLRGRKIYHHGQFPGTPSGQTLRR